MAPPDRLLTRRGISISHTTNRKQNSTKTGEPAPGGRTSKPRGKNTAAKRPSRSGPQVNSEEQ